MTTQTKSFNLPCRLLPRPVCGMIPSHLLATLWRIAALIVVPSPRIATDAANAGVFRRLKQVITRKRVSVEAVRFTGVDGRSADAAQNVFATGDNLDMCGVNARVVATQVIADQIVWDVTDKKNIHESMHKNPRGQHGMCHLCVSLVGSRLLPLPARIASIEMGSADCDVRKDPNKKFEIDSKITILGSGHDVFSCLENGLARLGQSVSAFCRAAFILPQTMQIRGEVTHI